MCCCSFVGQLLFGAVMLVALGLTLVSMFSPGNAITTILLCHLSTKDT
uniref:Inner membrane protein n=1 Tax=Ascaris lumbricoides TaxID=6252 RepID=A0A0M3HK73_ASCLU